MSAGIRRAVVFLVGLGGLGGASLADARPRITSIEPACAGVGAEVRILGRGLRRVAVDIGGASAPVIGRDRTSVTILVPGVLRSGPTTVAVVRGRSRSEAVPFGVRGPEICDGVDNNCSGEIDEGIADVVIGKRAGSGELELMRCRSGQLQRDTGDPPPPTEQCIPEVIEPCYDGTPETRGVGSCRDGAHICSLDGLFGPCQGQVLPGEEEPGNGIDENCDGRDAPGGGELCLLGTIRSCYSGPPRTRDVGQCRVGSRVCRQPGLFGPCEDEVLPGAEIPENGIDENCDGADQILEQQLELTVDPLQSPTFQRSIVVSGEVGTRLVPPGAVTPFAVTIAPTVGHQGQTLDVTLTATTGTFTANLASAAFGTGVEVNGVSVLGPTTLRANVSVAEDATIGPRVVAVSSGGAEAIANNAFNVEAGLGRISGRILDGNGQAVGGAQVCISGTNVCVTTNPDGTFELPDVPTTGTRLLVRKTGFDAINIPFSVAIGGTAGLGDLSFAPPSEPPPPPPPNSPVLPAAIASAIGRGAGDIREGGKRVVLEKLVRDTIVGLGDPEIGVLDSDGDQLNGKVTGNGYVSLEDGGVEVLAFELASTHATTLGDVLLRLLLSYDYGTEPTPRLAELLGGLQTIVNRAWADPVNTPAANLWFLLFNAGRVPSEEPPVLSIDTPLNSLQSWLLISSWFVWEKNARAGTIDPVPPSGGRNRVRRDGDPPPAVTDVSAVKFGWSAIFKDQSTDLGLKLSTNLVKMSCDNLLPQLNGVKPASCGNKKLDSGEQCDASAGMPACDAFCRSLLLPQAPTSCKNFADVYTELSKFAVKGRAAALQAATDRHAAFFKPEFVKTLQTTKPGLSPFQRASRAESDGNRIGNLYQSESFQSAYKKSRLAAVRTAAVIGLANLTKAYASEYLNRIQGQVVDFATSILVDAAIRSMRPQPPIISRVTQQKDETGQGLDDVKIEFIRSPNDDFVKQQQVQNNDPGILGAQHMETWWYRLWREQNGSLTLAASGQVKPGGTGPAPTGDYRRLVFHDSPGPGTAIYRIEAKRLIGEIPFEKVEDQPGILTNLLAGLFGATVDASKIVPARIGTFGLSSIQPALTPVASILRGVRLQSSEPSDPGVVFVDLGPPTPLPPFQLATSKVSSNVYLSNPRTGIIQRFVGDSSSIFTHAGFASSDNGTQQAGIAVDYAGAVYTDNSASDSRFGGRVFRYAHATGERSFVGSVNYFSRLLGYARPVNVLAMNTGPGPLGESVYIADSVNQRVTVLTINPPFADRARNISQPIGSFPFAGTTSIGVRADGKVAVTRFDEVYTFERFVNLNDAVIENVPRSLFGPGSPTPFTAVSGVDFDLLGNMYVSDSALGLVLVIPQVNQTEGLTFGQMTDVEKSRFIVARGYPGASDVHVLGDHHGIAFYDQSGVHVIGFGITGQVTDAQGAPIPGAQVTIPDLHRVAVTDGNGIYTLAQIQEETQQRIFDVVVRVGGRAQNVRIAINAVGHTIRDIVFAPVTPSDAGANATISTVASQPGPPVSIALTRGTAAVADVVMQIPKVIPPGSAVDPPPPFAVRVVTPVDGTVMPGTSTRVTGRMNRTAANEGRLLVNGQDRGPIAFVDGVFDATLDGLTEGRSAIQAKAFEPGPAGDVGRVTEGFEETLEASVGAVENEIGDLLGLVSGAAGESIASVGTVAGRSTTPEAAAQAEAAVAAAGDMIARMEQGLLPTTGQASALAQAAVSAASAQGTSARRIGGLQSRALGSSAFGKLAQSAASILQGTRTHVQGLAVTMQSAVNILGPLLDGITAQLGTTPLPGAVVDQLGAARDGVVATQAAAGGENIGQLIAGATTVMQRAQELQQSVAGLTAPQQALVGSFMAQLASTTQAAQQGVEGAAEQFAKTAGAVARVNPGGGGGGMFGKINVILQNVNLPIAPSMLNALGSIHAPLQALQGLLKNASADVAGVGAQAEAAITAAGAEAVTQQSGGGFLGAAVKGLGGVLQTLQADTIPKVNGLAGVAQAKLTALGTLLGTIDQKTQQVDAMPVAERPTSWGLFGPQLKMLAMTAQNGIQQHMLPALGQITELLRTGTQANQALTTLSEPTSVVVDSTATETSFLAAPGPEDAVEAASVQGEGTTGAQPAPTGGSGGLLGGLIKKVSAAVVLRIIDSDTGQPLGGSAFGIPGSAARVITDAFGIATLKFDPAVFKQLGDNIRPVLEELSQFLGAKTATVSTSTEAAEQKIELGDIIDKLGDLFARIPPGLAQAPAVKSAFGRVLEGATGGLQQIDAGGLIDADALQALGEGLGGLQSQIDDLLNNVRGALQLDANADQQVTITVNP